MSNAFFYGPLVRRFFFTNAQDFGGSMNWFKVGILYIVAGLLQTGWLFFAGSNYEIAKLWIGFPILGWIFITLWSLMVVAAFLLPYLGIQIICLGHYKKAKAVLLPHQERQLSQVILLLVLGVLMDVLAFAIILPSIQDKSAAVFLSAMMGGRVAYASFEAVFHYYAKSPTRS